MRRVPGTLDREVVAEIDRRLDRIATGGIRVPWAIESGSRAWGFPSPDSDYDCRFVYIRPESAYRSLWQGRDVIETPLDAVFDVSGWDVAKAIRLIVKGNATPVEWLRSPIVYRGEEPFRDRMLALAAEVAPRDAILRHYLHVGRRQAHGAPRLKRFFYALRPAFALCWLDQHPDSAVPPMALPQLVAECEVGDGIAEAVADLIRVKSETREMGAGDPPGILARFVANELDRDDPDPADSGDRAHAREVADRTFAEILES